jgi:putative SOS response-associated peptidase YedK
VINARAETVADGFYEWKKDGRTKTPFCFTMANDSLFAFAGLWEQWKNPEGQLVETCSIITTTPNSLLATRHRCDGTRSAAG